MAAVEASGMLLGIPLLPTRKRKPSTALTSRPKKIQSTPVVIPADAVVVVDKDKEQPQEVAEGEGEREANVNEHPRPLHQDGDDVPSIALNSNCAETIVSVPNPAVFMSEQQAMDVTQCVPLPALCYRDYKRRPREFAIIFHIDNPKGWEYFVDHNKTETVKSFVFIKKFEPHVELLAEPAGTFFRVKGTSKNVWFGWKMAHNGKPPYMHQVENRGGGFRNSPYWTTLIRDTLSKFCKGKQVKHTTHAERTLQSLSQQPDLDPMDLLRYLAKDRPDVESWEKRILDEIRNRPTLLPPAVEPSSQHVPMVAKSASIPAKKEMIPHVLPSPIKMASLDVMD